MVGQVFNLRADFESAPVAARSAKRGLQTREQDAILPHIAEME